ncbi:hypothetical protein Leryth_013119 [Lithospermum erythrorhizon]|nr:hypothetical protein Leryth_013119 [Lithospermum erythrorhizon]
MEPTDTDVPDPSDCGTPLITKNGLRLYPVPIGDSGDGLPYAPADWPNPGDIWRWKTGKRLKTNGYFKDRYLYPPKHLLKRDILPRKYPFASKPSLEEYLQSMFPGADINSFFDSFSWEIPSQQLSNKIENSDSDPLLGSVGCKAGNTTCSSLVESGNTPSEFMSCNICCSEQGFCRYCCCILCCKIASSGYGGFCYIRCEQRIDEGYICGHIAHIDCGLRAYMAGTVGGSIGLDAEYYCRRCDSRTDLVQHVMKLVDISQTINSEDKMEKVLNVCICLLRNSHRASAQQLFDNIQAAIVKLNSLNWNAQGEIDICPDSAKA